MSEYGECFWELGLSKNQLKKEVFEILQNSDLTVLTRKSVQNQLEQKHGIRYDSKTDLTQSLADRKGEIKLAINDFLLLSNVISTSQKAKEQVWKGMVVISRIRGTIIHRILMCLDVAAQMNVFFLDFLLTRRIKDRRELFSRWGGKAGSRPAFCQYSFRQSDPKPNRSSFWDQR